MRKLFELFDSNIPYNVTEETADSFIVEFMIEDLLYTFLADYSNLYGWDIQFGAGESGEVSITNTGNQFTVFATIGSILMDFINFYSPDIFHFSATKTEMSRVKLYSIFAKKIQSSLHYAFKIVETDYESIFKFYKE